jgi:hypothetical protein
MKTSRPTKHPKKFTGSRPTRVLVPNREPVRIAVGMEASVIGTMHKLSTTGGSVCLNKFFAEGVFAEITLETMSGKVHCPIQFLRKAVDGVPTAQAFSFVNMDKADRARLAVIIDGLRDEGFGDSGRAVIQPLRSAARRALAALQFRIS